MQTPVYIAGGGMICALGNNVSESINSFRNHVSGVGPTKYLPTVHHAEFPLAEVKLSNEELAIAANLPPTISRTISLSYYAVLETLKLVAEKDISQYRKGFISGNTVGGMDRTEFFYRDFLQDHKTGDLRDIMFHDNGKSTDFIAQKCGFTDFITTISTACSSSANSIMLGSRMIRSGRLDMVLAGGVDALTRFTLNGFNSLMIVDREQCRPLDETRVGLNLGEGAGYVLLVSEKVAKELSINKWCNVSGYGNTNDSFHQTALSEDGNGPFLAMEAALKMSKLNPNDISYINMHGTGTQNNDQAEGKAVQRIFHPHYPKLSTTKSFTGHTLGASGAIEAIFSALAIRDGFIYPNYSFKNPIKGLNILPETVFQENMDVNHVLSNSFGFGGNCTSLIFSKN